MKIKENLFLFLSLILTINLSIAQDVKVTSTFNYLNYYKNDNDKEALLKAKENIDAASIHEKTMLDAKTWFYVSSVYALLAQDKEYSHKYPDAKTIANNAVKKCLELDTKKKYTDLIINSIKPMMTNQFNTSIEKFQKGDYTGSYNDIKEVKQGFELLKPYTKFEYDTFIYQVMGLAAFNTDKKDEALENFIILKDMNFTDASIYKYMYDIYKAKNNNEKAQDVIKEGLAKFPNDEALRIEEINNTLASGDQYATIKKLEETILIDPKNSSLYFALGTLYDNIKNIAKAKENYLKAIEFKPDFADACYNLGAVFFNEGVDRIKKANELPIEAATEYEKLRAEAKDLFSQALPHFEKVLTINKDDFNSMVALKEIYAKLNMNEKADQMKTKIDALKK